MQIDKLIFYKFNIMSFSLYKISENINENVLFCPWTFVHFLSGVFFCFLFEYLKIDRFSGFILFFILHLIYELKDLHFSHLYNSSINTIGDTLGSSIGYLFTLYIIYSLKIKVEGIHVFMSFIIYIFLAVFLFILYEYILNLNQSKKLKLKYFPLLFI
jgi:hypothetical protein